MTKAVTTKQKLLQAARRQFWTRGYSNVSVRDITGEAGVDAALVSRYFGSKQGLFEATLEALPPWDALTADPDRFLDLAVETFSQPYDPDAETDNAFTMLLTNILDPEMGETMRNHFQDGIAAPLAAKVGGEKPEQHAAMLLAVLFGAALMRKQFRLSGLAGVPTETLRAQVLHLAQAALRF
ncbi:MAG: TetR family transcriptional regulator [Pseudomonadota bacterium]